MISYCINATSKPHPLPGPPRHHHWHLPLPLHPLPPLLHRPPPQGCVGNPVTLHRIW
jgi:hypothetical protein